MTKFADLTSEQQVETMLPLAKEIIAGFDLGECELESINHEFNSTFKVTAANGDRYALRINVNSQRTLPNLKAEIFWVEQLSHEPGIQVPKPIANRSGEFISKAWHPILQRDLLAVLFTWLEGAELGDEPTEEMMRATGQAVARMHLASRDTQLPAGAELAIANDMFWGNTDSITPSDQLSAEDKATLKHAIERIEQTMKAMYARTKPQLIHADVHPWNVMWHEGDVAIFDFDDCVIGLPAQDIAVTLYYNDTPEQDQAFLDGYRDITPLPDYSDEELQILRLQRRIFLLDSILDSENPEIRALLPKYLEKSLERITEVLG
jgi:Ser/Thr protein kinase RdoA (MazF antagonist)